MYSVRARENKNNLSHLSEFICVSYVGILIFGIPMAHLFCYDICLT